MKALTIQRELYTFDEPLVVEALDTDGRLYIGVHVPGYDEPAFVFVAVDRHTYTRFLSQEVDLRFLLTTRTFTKPRFGRTGGYAGQSLRPTIYDGAVNSFLPAPGFFLPRLGGLQGDHGRVVRTIKIDGQWGLDDLKYFSDRLQDSYAFVYALQTDDAASQKKVRDLFGKYPWRGGYSSINFFDSIYRAIPRGEAAKISRIEYASPGQISVEVNTLVANFMGDIIHRIVTNPSFYREQYISIRNLLRSKQWLRQSQQDIKLSKADTLLLHEKVKSFADCLMLQDRISYVGSLALEDPLASIKILLSFYRKLNDLAKYVATGKARDIFRSKFNGE